MRADATASRLAAVHAEIASILDFIGHEQIWAAFGRRRAAYKPFVSSRPSSQAPGAGIAANAANLHRALNLTLGKSSFI